MYIGTGTYSDDGTTDRRYPTNLYSYDGKSWTFEKNIGDIKYMAIYNNKLYIISYYVYTYKNNTFTLIDNNNNIENIYSYNGELYEYRYNGSSDQWVMYKFDGSKFNETKNTHDYARGMYPHCIYNGKIIAEYTDNTNFGYKCYEFNIENNALLAITNPPIYPYSSSKLYSYFIVFNNEIYIYFENSNTMYMYKYNGSTWVQLNNIPNIAIHYYIKGNYACVYKNKMYFFDASSLLGATSFVTYSAPEKKFDNGTLIIQKSKDDNYGLYKVALNDKYGIINHFGFDDAFFYGNGGFEWDTEMYYGDGAKWIRFK